ncbi:lanthionine synthetase C family protein [Nocardiopsis sp. NRRL B-16309]|uniref:lanthionine synthetase C family protein n=1 Tax=Nocardiopsis sp. NRRL B-16309 TaxID=1519494 RepID=UPI0006ADF9FB|nr:lanthionine synthetase C family protein [Nocardiopsis sp. NRRL B-16309]KOX16917.1 hypothetical protein ADL05_09825 [Nocardiopsis sp. NRRL B-16309]
MTTSDTALAVAGGVAERLATPEQGFERSRDQWWPQSLAQGAAGIALLHIERARTGHGSWEPVHLWLKAMVADGVKASPDAHLFFGAPAVLLALHHAESAGLDCGGELTRLDPVLLRGVRRRLGWAHERADRGELPTLTEFDAIRGLTGLGHLLMLRAPESAELRQVMEYLVRLSEPVVLADGGEVPGWWTRVGPSGKPSDAFPGGHANHGMAHGIGGPLALLSLALIDGVRVPGQPEAIRRILAWLDTWHNDGPGGTWWPYWATAAQHQGAEQVTGPQRPSWCYGAGGLGRAQQLAAGALGDTERAASARQTLTDVLTHSISLGMVVDDSLCHGWAGHALLAHTSGLGHPFDLLAPILSGGDPDVVAEQLLAPRGPRSGIGMLEGGAGTATALHTLGSGSASSWFSFLLIGDSHG